MASSKNTPQLTFFKYLAHMEFGTIEVKEPNTIFLTVGCREIDVSNITEEDIEWLDQHLEVAYFSENNVKTTNTNVRNSKHTKAFLLNLNLNNKDHSLGLKGHIKPYKLNLYKGGCFFSTHRDTSRPGLVGTLVLILPTDYTGGELRFGDFNAEAYQKQYDEKACSKNIRYIFFDSEIEHSVSEVTSGNRISVVYNVFDNELSAKDIAPEVSFTTPPVEWIDEVIKYACEFCEGKKNVLLGDFAYRNNAVFEKALLALKDKYEVINVTAEKNDNWDPNGTIKNVCAVHVIDSADEENSEGSNSVCSEVDNLEYSELIKSSYTVEHVLFSRHAQWKDTETRGGKKLEWRGNSPGRLERSAIVKYYTGYLINPYLPY